MPTNVRLFLAFRLLFNCRFYYPIFTILFLDLGLSLGEFATLNVVWALTIVLLEVPSGALADRFGRRPLVVAAGWLMVAEMALLCLMPPGQHDLVFWMFVVNRILSGTAEACASGADEALAYDSLPEAERTRRWPSVMARLSRLMAIGFIISSISGGLLYDHERVSALLSGLGLPVPDRAWTMKLPLLLNLLAAFACLGVALRLREPGQPPSAEGSWTRETARALRGILATGAWVWRHEAAFRLLVLAVVFDSIIRLFLTVTSNFYRLVGIDEAWYGVIATVSSLLGLASAGLMERMTRHGRERDNFLFVAALTLAGLLGAAYPQPGWAGIALVMPLMLAMRFLQFFLSHHLNAAADSAHRATVLSFRGLTTNLAYGLLTLIFGWHCAWLQNRLDLPAEDPGVFAASLKVWPAWFIGSLGLALLVLYLHRQFCRKRSLTGE
jgi:MFS family permease